MWYPELNPGTEKEQEVNQGNMNKVWTLANNDVSIYWFISCDRDTTLIC